MADQLVVKTPGAIQDEHQPDLSRLSDEKLDQLERLIESAHPGKLLPASVAATVTATVLFEVAASAAPPGLS
jgi:hypothetical protein